MIRWDMTPSVSARMLHSDERGSIVAESDASGNAVAINRYDEYGKPQPGNVGRFQYTGQLWLPELSLYHYKARAYAPHLGRFLQTDPIGYEGGVNLYPYVGNDPVNWIDPLGLNGQDIVVTGSLVTSRVFVASSYFGNTQSGFDASAFFAQLDDQSQEIVVRGYRTVKVSLVSAGGHTVNTVIYLRDLDAYLSGWSDYVEESREYHKDRVIRLVLRKRGPAPRPPVMPALPEYHNVSLDTRYEELSLWARREATKRLQQAREARDSAWDFLGSLIKALNGLE